MNCGGLTSNLDLRSFLAWKQCIKIVVEYFQYFKTDVQRYALVIVYSFR